MELKENQKIEEETDCIQNSILSLNDQILHHKILAKDDGCICPLDIQNLEIIKYIFCKLHMLNGRISLLLQKILELKSEIHRNRNQEFLTKLFLLIEEKCLEIEYLKYEVSAYEFKEKIYTSYLSKYELTSECASWLVQCVNTESIEIRLQAMENIVSRLREPVTVHVIEKMVSSSIKPLTVNVPAVIVARRKKKFIYNDGKI